MALHKTRKTKNSTKHNPPETTPQPEPHDNCLFFKLPPELRDIIYAYAFTSNLQAPEDGNPPIVELGDLETTVPSSAFLLTCRQVEQEAAAIFRDAHRPLWKNVVLSIDLSDGWEDVHEQKQRHFEVLDLLDKAFLLPDLSDA